MPTLFVDPANSDFVRLRRTNGLYVDKTAQIASFLATGGSASLFTRPRRFGKSLMLSTIAVMYQGNREIFGGNDLRPELAVYPCDAWHWRTHPVLRLDMSEVHATGNDGIGYALADQVYVAADLLEVQGRFYFQRDNPTISLQSLIQAVAAHWDAPLVILVDEYDAPILEHMHQPQGATIRRQLADFYGVFKSQGCYIEKLVMTGVTRFAKTGLWSCLNQVQDWTDSREFHDLAGFTDWELDALWEQAAGFLPEVPEGGSDLTLSRTGWQEWYNGYRFAEGLDPVYNPYAIVCSLHRGQLGAYWSESGHLGVVENLLQEPRGGPNRGHALSLYLTSPPPINDYTLHLAWLDQLTPGLTPEQVLLQWEPSQLVPLLYQTGYLTLTAGNHLAPPNREVAAYLSQVLLKPGLEPVGLERALALQSRLLDALRQLDVPRVVENFNSLLRLLPHQRFHGNFPAVCNLVLDLAVLLSRGQIQHRMEHSGLQGDADTVLSWDDVALVLEFKSGPSASSLAGQLQMERKAYLRSLPETARLYLGLALHTENRQITAWHCQGYTGYGLAKGDPLIHEDVWPASRAAIYRRWAADAEENSCHL